MAYEIQFITEKSKAKLKVMDKRLKVALESMSCVQVRDQTGIREVNFPAEGCAGAKPTKQWRKLYIISKSCRKPTWNEVMTKINKIYAPYYKRV